MRWFKSVGAFVLGNFNRRRTHSFENSIVTRRKVELERRTQTQKRLKRLNHKKPARETAETADVGRRVKTDPIQTAQEYS